MFMESVQFAKQEVEQRQKAPVIVKAEETGRGDDGVRVDADYSKPLTLQPHDY